MSIDEAEARIAQYAADRSADARQVSKHIPIRDEHGTDESVTKSDNKLTETSQPDCLRPDPATAMPRDWSSSDF